MFADRLYFPIQLQYLLPVLCCLTPECVRFCKVSDHVEIYANHIQIYVQKRPRTYEKHQLNLLKSFIPDISTSTSTIYSVETLEKLCQTM